MWSRRIVSVMGLMLCSGLGCAPRPFSEQVLRAADRHGVRDAATLAVAAKGHLRFTTALRSDLDDAIAGPDLAAVRESGAEVLHRANALAIASATAEIERLPSDAITELIEDRGSPEVPGASAGRREYLGVAYAREARAALELDLRRLAATADLGGARRVLQRIRDRIEPPAGDRGKLARVLLGAPGFVPASIGAEMVEREALHRELMADFTEAIEYRPETMDVVGPDDLAQASAADLARWYAPVIVQQVDGEAGYRPSEDCIGRVALSGTSAAVHVQVDIADPVVYWMHLEAKVGTHRYHQLVYAAWYPSRPALAPNDSQAGRIDGVVVRVTLDRHRRPAIYEFVRSCGCYHTLWVSEFIEAAARMQFGAPAGNRRFAVQRPAGGRELFVPDVIEDDGGRPRRPIVFISAGHHLVMGVTPVKTHAMRGATRSERRYRLEPYETLTHLPLGDGVASMFGSDGLVHDAGRGEGWLLAPTGMLSAGQPRQLGTMKIHMDAYDYDDPRLLERNLRLPAEF